MKFENPEEKAAYIETCKLLGIHRHTHFSYSEKVFYRKSALAQATLRGWGNKTRHRMNSIHKKRDSEGNRMTADHIVPLNGVDSNGVHIVCGLNVPWNLRAMPKKENKLKANLFVDSPDAIGIILPLATIKRLDEEREQVNIFKTLVDSALSA